MTTKCEDIASKVSLVDAEYGTPLLSGAIRLRSCSTTIGIGAGSSSISINLVTDTCKGGVPTLPPVGTPATFTCGLLVFGGIINSLGYSESSNGFEYTVSIIDPKKLLEGVSVLLTTYFCDPIIPGVVVANFININGLLEAGVAICPPGEKSQDWPKIGNCTNFGLAGGNSQGPFLWRVLEKIQSEYGGMKSLYTTSGRKIHISMLPLVSLLKARAPYARASGLDSKLADLINQACDLVSCDYIILLVGIYATVYIIDRSFPPSPGYIQNLINQAQSEGILISGSIGKDEIYAVSNNFILGDNVNYLAERSNRDRSFSMMLGEDLNGEPVRVKAINFTAAINITPVIEILSAGGFGANIPKMFNITEAELLSCGSLQAWRTFGLCKGNENSLSSNIASILDFKAKLPKVIAAIARLTANAGTDDERIADIKSATTGGNLAYTAAGKAAGKPGNALLVEKKIYEWLDQFVRTYYGRHWLVPMNGICMTPNNPAAIKVKAGELYDFTDEPADSGYPSPSQNNILGLTYGVNTTLFEQGNGKITAFIVADKNLRRNVTINGNTISHQIDFSDLPASQSMVFGDKLYVKAEMDGTMYRNKLLNQPEVLLVTPIVSMVIADKKTSITKGLRSCAYLFGTANSVLAGGKPADKESVNSLMFKGVAAGIQYALVPMKSNVYVYGPWFDTAGPYGATNIKQDPALNPWTCGGYASLDTVGQSSASLGVRLSNEQESGRMELAEPPGYSIQSFITAGVVIDSITVSYRDGGATTSYSFQQYAQKFGNYNLVLSERLKKTVAEKNLVLGRLRKQRLETQTRVRTVEQEAWKQEHITDKASPGFCLVGSYSTPIQTETPTPPATNVDPVLERNRLKCEDQCVSPTDSPNSSLNTIKNANPYEAFLFDPNDWGSMSGGASEADIQDYAALSLDAIFAPVSLLGRGGRLPRYVSNWSTGKEYCRTRPAMPPINAHTPLAINQKYLNPILSKGILQGWDTTRSASQNAGVSIKRISFGTDIESIGIYTANRFDDATDFGFFSLRGPLVLQSWGYDTENKPIPNAADTEGSAIQGQFVNSKLKNTFMGNWLKNPKTWPVGPIDLRYDRERGVWVSPPAERVVVAQLKTQLKPRSSAEAMLLNPMNDGDNLLFYDNYHIDGAQGQDLGAELKCEITVFDYLGNDIKAGTIIYAMHNDQRYIVIGVGGSGSGSGSGLSSKVGPDAKEKLQVPCGEKSPMTEYAITDSGNSDCSGCDESEEEEFCPTDACGLSDCIKDIYGRTLLPVITKDASGPLQPPFKEAGVSIPWGGTKEDDKDVGPFGRKAKLPTYASFASGVLGIDGCGCLKIYSLASCGIVDPPATSPPATPAPNPGGSTGSGGTSTIPIPAPSVPVPTPQAPPVTTGGATTATMSSPSDGITVNTEGTFIITFDGDSQEV